jgi:hypothetical protein
VDVPGLVRQPHACRHAAEFWTSGRCPRAVQEIRDCFPDRGAVADPLRGGFFGAAQPADCFSPGSLFACQATADIGEEVGAA